MVNRISCPGILLYKVKSDWFSLWYNSDSALLPPIALCVFTMMPNTLCARSVILGRLQRPISFLLPVVFCFHSVNILYSRINCTFTHMLIHIYICIYIRNTQILLYIIFEKYLKYTYLNVNKNIIFNWLKCIYKHMIYNFH